MIHPVISFDLLKSERSSRVIKTESEKLIRAADKLAASVGNISSWWEGDSKNCFTRQANELVHMMRKTAEAVLEMSEIINKSAEYKKAVEEHMKNEASKPVNFKLQIE